MPKNCSRDLLLRWVRMDALLGSSGLDVASFADEWQVTTKTVYRDLKLFAELGYPSDQRAVCTPADLERLEVRWFYRSGRRWPPPAVEELEHYKMQPEYFLFTNNGYPRKDEWGEE